MKTFEITFDPRYHPENKILFVAVLVDGVWAAEIYHDDKTLQTGEAMHVWSASGKTLFGGNKWEPKTLWECRRWCEEAVEGGVLRAASRSRPMTQDERDDTILTR